jgi:hypothetical protein
MLKEALYLPQFHSFKENDEWWGKDFTEWTNLDKARKFHKKQILLKTPSWGEYNLMNERTMEKQYQYAKEIGIDIFSIYHYWSDGSMLMEKPVENIIANKNIDFKFYLNWANHHFYNKVHFSSKKLLWKQTYNNNYIEQHVRYLHNIMEDHRYHKINDKPVLNIYDPRNIPEFNNFFSIYKEYFFKLYGTEIHLRATLKDYKDFKFIESNKDIVDSVYEYHPVLANHHSARQHYLYEFKLRVTRDIFKKLTVIDARKVVQRIVSNKKKIKGLPYGFGVYSGWDTTPRWGNKGIIHINFNKDLFLEQIQSAYSKADDEDFIVVTAWNEWGEGAILEPCEERDSFSIKIDN